MNIFSFKVTYKYDRDFDASAHLLSRVLVSQSAAIAVSRLRLCRSLKRFGRFCAFTGICTRESVSFSRLLYLCFTRLHSYRLH